MATDSGEELAKLVREHEAITAGMKWIEDSLVGLVPGPVAEASKDRPPRSLRDSIWSLRWVLTHLRDGAKEHMEREELLLGAQWDRDAVGTMKAEHSRILGEIDAGISAADRATRPGVSEEGLTRAAAHLRETLRRVRELVLAHIAREEEQIKSSWKTP